MTSLRSIALAATLFGSLAAPALAQTPPPAATTEAQTAVPDTGMKKMSAPKVHQHTHHHAHVKAVSQPTPPTR